MKKAKLIKIIKTVITVILFVLSIVVLVAMIAVPTAIAIDNHAESQRLASKGASGSEYLGIAVANGFGIVFALGASAVGLILCGINAKISNIKFIKNCSIVMCLLAVLFVYVAFLILASYR